MFSGLGFDEELLSNSTSISEAEAAELPRAC